MKIAIIEASHWHAPNYVDILEETGRNVVAVSDKKKQVAESVASRLGCSAYSDYRELVAKEKPDFVFAFGIHREMPEIAAHLIKSGIPFAIEKPLGKSAGDVKKLMQMKEARDHFVAIPFVFRHSSVLDNIEELKSKNELGSITHLYFRFIAGPPTRYPQTDSGWMLDLEQSGGGCTINLGVHFIDFFLSLIGDKKVRSVFAALNNLAYQTEIETFSTVVLRAEDNVHCTIETGYAYPMTEERVRDIDYTITTTNGYISITDGRFLWLNRKQDLTEKSVSTATTGYYARFINDTLNALEANERPKAGLEEMYEVMQIIDCVYESNKSQSVVPLN